MRAIEELEKARGPQSAPSFFSSDPGLTSAIRVGGAVPASPPTPSAPPPPPASLSGSLAPPLTSASTGDFTGAFEALHSSSRVSAAPIEGATAQKPKRPTSAVMPPRDISGTPRPISGFVPRGKAVAADNPQRALDDARRLARLLISEIKLYNEKKVEDGRAAGNLYERLKDDIERSRKVYDERTPAAIRKDTDFFQDEIVRILADGRAEALGSVS